MSVYKSKIIAGIEIGTGKVSVLLGEIVEGRSLNIIGKGQCSSHGVLKGDIVDFHETRDCVHAATMAAQNQARVKVDGVYLAVSGTHLEGYASVASVNPTGEQGRVIEEDLKQVTRIAEDRELPENRTIIHNLRRPYLLDGRVVGSPVGMQGDQLEASFWSVHGDARKLSDAIHVINGFNLHVDDVILSGIASSAAVTTDEERRSGVLVIDIGGGTTDYALYAHGKCMIAGALPIGGDHISNDISIGMRMRLKQAESLKIRYGSAVVEHLDKSEKVWMNNEVEIGDRPISLWSLEKIIELRTEEIFEVVLKKLGGLYRADKLGAGVVLCGGSASLRNVGQCASKVFEAGVRLGDNANMAQGELKDSQYSTALGLLHYGLITQNENGPSSRPRGIWGKLKGLLQ